MCVDASLVTETSNSTNTSKDCSENNGNCCQVCTATEEGEECGCYDGYALNIDKRTCSGAVISYKKLKNINMLSFVLILVCWKFAVSKII